MFDSIFTNVIGSPEQFFVFRHLIWRVDQLLLGVDIPGVVGSSPREQSREEEAHQPMEPTEERPSSARPQTRQILFVVCC